MLDIYIHISSQPFGELQLFSYFTDEKSEPQKKLRHLFKGIPDKNGSWAEGSFNGQSWAVNGRQGQVREAPRERKQRNATHSIECSLDPDT